MCTFKRIAVTDWGLYQKFHGGGDLDAYAAYLAGLMSGTASSVENSKLSQPDILILREKNLPEEMYMELFIKLWETCKNFQAQAELIPHTHLLAAQQTGCKRIHLPFPVFKGCLADPIISKMEKIGVSVHSFAEAKKAEAMGASYLTAGHIFPTDCKKGVPARGLEFLKELCRSVAIPVYAIGGIHSENLSQIQGVGAAGASMMSEYMRGNP